MYILKKIKNKISSKFSGNNKKLVKVENGVRIGIKTRIGPYSFIGANSNIGDNCISIGSYCSIGQNTLIGPNIHPVDRLSTSAVFYSSSWGYVEHNEKDSFNSKSVILGNDVWVGAYSIILPGINIGDGVVIGANSVVTKDVPDFAIVAGNPARIIRFRFDERKIRELKKTKWWEKTPQDVIDYYNEFKNNK